MVEVRITYESLFDLLRRERGRIELQKLDGTFMDDVQQYVREKAQLADRDADNVAARIQLTNAKKILKELYERRERKLMALALDTSRLPTAVFDSTCLLPHELAIFTEACAFLAHHKEQVLSPLIGPGLKAPAILDERAVHPDAENPREVPEGTAEPLPGPVIETVRIKFLSPIPKFVGPKRQVFGPFGKEEEANLPGEIAKLLIRKGRALPVEM